MCNVINIIWAYLYDIYVNCRVYSWFSWIYSKFGNPRASTNNIGKFTFVSSGITNYCYNKQTIRRLYEKEIDLTPREFEVLYLLAQRPNWVIPKKNIYCSVWESNYYDDQIPYKTVEHVVWKIRKKMGHDIIETLINVGYRLKKM